MFPAVMPNFQTNFSSYVSSSNLAEEVSRAPMGEPQAILLHATADHQSRDTTDVIQALWLCGVFLCAWEDGWAFCVCVSVCKMLLSSQ